MKKEHWNIFEPNDEFDGKLDTFTKTLIVLLIIGLFVGIFYAKVNGFVIY